MRRLVPLELPETETFGEPNTKKIFKLKVFYSDFQDVSKTYRNHTLEEVANPKFEIKINKN